MTNYLFQNTIFQLSRMNKIIKLSMLLAEYSRGGNEVNR